MNQPIYLILILLFQAQILRGQLKPKDFDQTAYPLPELILKFSPMSLIDPFGPTAALYFEQQLPAWKKWRSMEYEAGYTFTITGLTKKAFGYRLRTVYRHYWGKGWKRRNNVYGAIALMHRQFFDKSTSYVWRENQAYQQNMAYQLVISQQTLTYNVGVTRYFGRADRWILDASLGLGARVTSIKFKDLPTDAYTPEVPDVFESNYKAFVERTTDKNRRYFFHNTAIALKLGYVLQVNSFSKRK